MRNDSRTMLVAAAVAGLLGVVSIPIAATEPVPTLPVPPVATSEPVWPPTEPQKGSTTTTTTTTTSTTAQAPVSTTPVRTTTSPPIATTAQSPIATTPQPPITSSPPITSATTSVEIGPAPVVTTTAEDPTPTEPTGGRPPTAQPPDGGRQASDAGDLLGLSGFLLALGAALLLARARRKGREGASPTRNDDPRPPQVGVRVVANSAPTIHIRQVVRAPVVRVRLRAGEPWLHIEEVHG
ncbi:hypothetical protein [Nocardia asiatica]|uniref:hypothetical protein n=1 Tax=Nocardia asiatica TaxID=209252 RepID=UPI00245859EB|nr:hypothetical protein [Nocardia asiatica]